MTLAPSIANLGELVRRVAAGSPESPALLAPGRAPLTYRALAEQVDAVAGHLAGLGIVPGDRVAIVLGNGPEMATAFLGVASVATCAPLNPAYGRHELDFYLADLNARLLVTADGPDWLLAAEVARSKGIPLIAIRVDPSLPAGQMAFSNLAPVAEPRFANSSDIALILHTSGTTARPKMVPLTHGNLLASARNVRDALALTPKDRCLNVMPLFHIHGLVAGLLASLDAGASVACCPPFNSSSFFAWWSEMAPTWYTAVPTMHQAILAQAPDHADLIARGRPRLVRSSSAALPPTVMADLESAFGCPVIEAYGMTEAAHQMASNPLPPRPRKPGTVGLAAGPEVAVMGDDNRLLQKGEIGEVVIRGANVTPGYADNPEANQAAYVGGWFRTGDQGMIDADGYLTLTGRLKELINRGGEKIAPRELDEALLEFPTVVQAVAFAVPHRTLGEDVAAAVVLRDGSQTKEAELREFLLRRLNPSKVPSRIVFVNEIPKGGTGKVQRIGLHEKLRHALETSHVELETDAELALAELWQELLDQSQIGAEDNFFWLGGDSLLAGRLAVRIHAAFDLSLSLQDIFQFPTLGRQAALIEQKLIDEIGRR